MHFDVKTTLAKNPSSGAKSNKDCDYYDEEGCAGVALLQTTIRHLESELEAALAQNADLSRMERLAQEKLIQTEMDLESAIVELTQSRAREQGQLMLAAAAAAGGGGHQDHRERYDDRDDDDGEDNDDSADEESTESEERSDGRSGSSSEGEDEEGGDGEEFDEPEVIEIDDDDEEEEPTPKKQKIYEDV